MVSRVLRGRGHRVYDCDLEARMLMENSPELKEEITKRLGEECVTSSGSLHRRNIAAKVFSDSVALSWLNSRVHALVRADLRTCAKECDADVFFVESAILHTSGLDLMCDAVWIVSAPEQTRLRRAMLRDGSDRENVMARMKAQGNELKNIRCQEVMIVDNGDNVSLLTQIDNLLKLI